MSSAFAGRPVDWKPLFRIGGTAALLFVASGVAALTLYLLDPPPVTGGRPVSASSKAGPA